MGLKWLSGIGKLNKLDILNRINITQDGTLEIDGQPQQSTGGGNAELLAIKEVWSGSSTITKTFTDSMYGFDIVNDGNSDLTFTINGLTVTVKSGEVFGDVFEEFTSVTITTTVPYRATVKESLSGTLSPSNPSPSNDTTAPNPVTNLVTGTTTTTSIPITWTKSTSTDVANYEVAYSTDGTNFTVASSSVNASSTSYTLNGLTSNTSYTIRVVAIDTSNNRSTSVTITPTTAVATDTTPPVDVTNLTTSNVTDTSLTLSWTASTSTDISSYDVYQGSTLLGNTTSTTYNVTGLTASTSYTFKVFSKDTSGNASTGITVTQTTNVAPVTDTTPPIITASPVGGTYTSAQSVTLTANETATIYYTTDGTTPTTSSAVYSTPISISATTTLKYFGADSAGNSSTVQTQTYTISNTPSQTDVIYDNGGYLAIPANDNDALTWVLESTYVSSGTTTIKLANPLSSLFDVFMPSSNIVCGNFSYVTAPGNLTLNSYTLYNNLIYIRVDQVNGTTVDAVLSYLHSTFVNFKIKLVSTYKTYTVTSNISGTTTRSATTGYEYFKCTLLDGLGSFTGTKNSNRQFSTNGYLVHPGYVWSATSPSIQINSDATLEMLLPSGTLTSIDDAGVSSFLNNASIKIYYV